jgi:hypothetical protein
MLNEQQLKIKDDNYNKFKANSMPFFSKLNKKDPTGFHQKNAKGSSLIIQKSTRIIEKFS